MRTFPIGRSIFFTNMTLVTLFVTATKLAGILVSVTVAANAYSFSCYRRKNLKRFKSPIDESADVLADFDINSSSPDEEKGFFFGLATAPAHVEDKLDDAWLRFAEEHPCDRPESIKGSEPVDAVIGTAGADGSSQPASMPGIEENKSSKRRKEVRIAMEAKIRGYKKFEEIEQDILEEECHHTVAAWHNVPHPEERLRFWSDPDTELKLASDTGVQVFRMGIDWTRIIPKNPTNGLKETVNFAALERYKWIIEKVRSYGMKVMLTLFHHSLPPWAAECGGWKVEKTVEYFMDFTRLVVECVSGLVDYWVTFNEPHIFCLLTYTAGAWPGGNPDMLEAATSTLPAGVFNQAMHWMAVAHLKAFDYIHEKSMNPNAIVGVAHHVSFIRPYGLFDIAPVSVANSLALFPFIDKISAKMDYIGINYYGQEVVSRSVLKLVKNDEYSESGRGVYPDGLFRILLHFHERYKHLGVPFIITENGVSDETDLIRRPYMLEHLLATYSAMRMGVPILGYLFWTISDNWEWADGYGPKFGLVGVDRSNNLARIPRASYNLFSKVVKTRKITRLDRLRAWNELQRAAREKKERPFYRAVNKNGDMYAGGLDIPISRPFVERDWRFGHYEMEGLQDPLCRFLGLLLRPLSIMRRVKPENDLDEDLIHEPLESSVSLY
ncbi:beta-glucosidase-like SFR2, chloroplastic [Primulina tabacum]|uniref:beta-glucosidase-like SFR2, chloroplastic n=1 Tax=Primulina tabacum TaxID=48773 RepID=UPI003F5A7A11